MDKFYVGQKVRHVNSISGAIPVGCVGTISYIDVLPTRGTVYFVDWDLPGYYWSFAWQIEPLRDDDEAFRDFMAKITTLPVAA